MHYYIVALPVVISFIVYVITKYLQKPMFPYTLSNKSLTPQMADILLKNQVPVFNMEQCYNNRFEQCNPYNGSYQQCTNNYIPQPKSNYCQCRNRNNELCPYPYRVSNLGLYKDLSESGLFTGKDAMANLDASPIKVEQWNNSQNLLQCQSCAINATV